MSRDFLLTDKLHIYNNRAKSGESEGRLSVVYNIYPSPAIFWEFETFDKSAALPARDGNYNITSPFVGDYFIMPESRAGSHNETPKHEAHNPFLRGAAPKVCLGDLNLPGKNFTFYIPNAKFQAVGLLKNFLSKEYRYHKNTDDNIDPNLGEFGGQYREGFSQAKIREGATIELHTPKESLDWLENPRSTGTYITTYGVLSVEEEFSIENAASLLSDLTYLLSFANGGLIGPMAIKMQGHGRGEEFPTMFVNFEMDSIEYINGTWLNRESDIAKLLECFSSFQKMLQSKQWEEDFGLILIWYFQAIQSPGIQKGGKPWPIVANALGAALEKLASIILVEKHGFSKTQFDKLSFDGQIRKLLNTIGVTDFETNKMIPKLKLDDKDAVQWFVKIRNDATHAHMRKKWGEEEVNVILNNAIQWIEEILLWRLGYQDGYSDRSRNNKFREAPRYNLETRDSSW